MYKEQHSTELGKYIAKSRMKYGLSQTELAIKCNISRTEISRIEDGIRKQPAINNLREIAKHTHANFHEIMRLAGYYPKSQSMVDVLQFYYPSIKTDAQVAIINKVAEIISTIPDVTEEQGYEFIKYAEFLAYYENKK